MSNATRGIYLERRVAEILGQRGYFTIRAAGSHGIADVVAIRPGHVVFVQCKTNGIVSGTEWNRLWEVTLALGAVPVIGQWHRGDARAGITFMEITGTHLARSKRWPCVQWVPENGHIIPRMDPETAERVQALELERLKMPPPRRAAE